jgi:hypothetical protein
MFNQGFLTAFIGTVATGLVAAHTRGRRTQWHAVTLVCVHGKQAPDPVPANRGVPVGLLDVALVQAAVHDAVQAIQGRFEAYPVRESGRDVRAKSGDRDAAVP